MRICIPHVFLFGKLGFFAVFRVSPMAFSAVFAVQLYQNLQFGIFQVQIFFCAAECKCG